MATLMALTRHLGFRVRFSHTPRGEMCVEWTCGCVGIGTKSWNELHYRGCDKHESADAVPQLSSDRWSTIYAADFERLPVESHA